MPSVKFNFRDSRGRPTSRTLFNVGATIAAVLTDVGTLAALWNPLTDLAFEGVNVSFVDPSSAFAGTPPSNIDENVSVQVTGADGYKYDLDLPDVPDAKTPGEAMSISDADLLAFVAAFQGAGNWRVNLRNPVQITQILKATLDK